MKLTIESKDRWTMDLIVQNYKPLIVLSSICVTDKENDDKLITQNMR